MCIFELQCLKIWGPKKPVFMGFEYVWLNLKTVWDGELHPNPNFISSPTNQMSHLTNPLQTKPFHYLIIYMCNNPNIHIIVFSLILHLNKEPYWVTCPNLSNSSNIKVKTWILRLLVSRSSPVLSIYLPPIQTQVICESAIFFEYQVEVELFAQACFNSVKHHFVTFTAIQCFIT